MISGVILRGIAGFYYVLSEGTEYECKARGIFRKEGVTPLAGDRVSISVTGDGEGWIEEILPRRNFFSRPPAANVDTLVLVMAARDPLPSFALVDRFTVAAERAGVELFLCVNKTDLAEPGLIEAFEKIYGDVYPLFFVCGRNSDGVEKLADALKGRQAALAGPSGTGKSTLTNLLLKDELSETGEISRKSQRGKNTTRHTELFPADGFALFDTPGFSAFEPEMMKEEELAACFPEFREYIGKCRFNDCMHLSEPDCAVTKALSEGKISRSRYRSYKEMLQQIRESREY